MEFRFLEEGQYLGLYFPAWDGILCYKIKTILNKGFELMEYGTLPVKIDPHPVGVLPADTVTDVYTFSVPDWLKDRIAVEFHGDMFYYEKRDRLLDVYLVIKPYVLLRHWIRYPKEIEQTLFLDMPTISERGDEYGFFRGIYRVIFLPYHHVGFRTWNPTSMNLLTQVKFIYREYVVEIITSKRLMRKLWLGDIPCEWITMPINKRYSTTPFERAYGDKGITEPVPLSEVLRERERKEEEKEKEKEKEEAAVRRLLPFMGVR